MGCSFRTDSMQTGIIRVPKGLFRVFGKLKNEIQISILRFCFYFNKEDEIQITDYHFHVQQILSLNF